MQAEPVDTADLTASFLSHQVCVCVCLFPRPILQRQQRSHVPRFCSSAFHKSSPPACGGLHVWLGLLSSVLLQLCKPRRMLRSNARYCDKATTPVHRPPPRVLGVSVVCCVCPVAASSQAELIVGDIKESVSRVSDVHFIEADNLTVPSITYEVGCGGRSVLLCRSERSVWRGPRSWLSQCGPLHCCRTGACVCVCVLRAHIGHKHADGHCLFP